MVEQKGEDLVNRCGFDGVVIVKDKNQVIWENRNLIEQGGQNCFDVDLTRGLQRGQYPCSNVALNSLQGSDKVGQETGQVIVPFIQ